jgi:hypothetical protein
MAAVRNEWQFKTATCAADGSYGSALAPELTGGVYINFLDGEEALRRIRDAYSAENFQRLRAIKRQIDPGDCFRHSFDIPLVV